MPGHSALARGSIFRLSGRIPAQFGGRYASGTDANQQLAFGGLRLRELGCDKRWSLGRVFTCIAFIESSR